MSSEFYDPETLSASFDELKKLLKFLDKLGVPHPAIIGGWAVYAYEKGMGSRDIDIVMVSESDIVQHLYNNYFPAHDFKEKKIGFFPDHHEKTVMTARGPRDIIVDIFDGQKQWKDEVNSGIKFHWGWTLKFQEQRTIDDLEIIVPKRELLIITKMMSAVVRSRMNDIEPNFRLPFKIQKDYRDVAVLTIGKELDLDFYKEYMKKSEAEQYLDEFLPKYKQDEHSGTLKDLNSNYNEIESILRI